MDSLTDRLSLSVQLPGWGLTRVWQAASVTLELLDRPAARKAGRALGDDD